MDQWPASNEIQKWFLRLKNVGLHWHDVELLIAALCNIERTYTTDSLIFLLLNETEFWFVI